MSVIHRLDRLEENVGSSEERNTERKMILHRLDDVETHVRENDYATKGMLKEMEDSIKKEIKESRSEMNGKHKELREENDRAHKDFDSRIIKLMLTMTALASGASWAIQYLII